MVVSKRSEIVLAALVALGLECTVDRLQLARLVEPTDLALETRVGARLWPRMAVDIPDASLEYCLTDRVTRQTAVWLASESSTIDDIWRCRASTIAGRM